jgi:hypothetical protein
MQQSNDVIVRVHESWNGWRSSEVRVDDLQDVRWGRPPAAPHAMIQAWVWCTQLQAGNLVHACDRTPKPHRIPVCVLKHHVIATTYAGLVNRANAGSAAAASTEGVATQRSLV